MPQNLASLSKNPVRQVRREHNLTLQALAEKCNVTLNAVYNQECGVYPYILGNILMVLVNEYGEEYFSLNERYKEFIKERRLTFLDELGPFNYRDIEVDATLSPIAVFRRSLDLSKMAFCKRLCIQPSLLNRCEAGACQTLPSAIVNALRQVGFEDEGIEELNYRQGEFNART